MSKIYSLQSIDKLKAKLGFRELKQINASVQSYLLDIDQEQRLLEVYSIMRNSYIRKRIAILIAIFLIFYSCHFWENFNSMNEFISKGYFIIHLLIILTLVMSVRAILLWCWMNAVNIKNIEQSLTEKRKWLPASITNLKPTNIDKLVLEYFKDSGKMAIQKFIVEEQAKLIDPIKQIIDILKKETIKNTNGYTLFKEIFKIEK